MIKTIKVKKVFTFRELMEYIIQNDVSGTFKNCDGHQFKVDKHGTFNFAAYSYGYGETYEVEVEEEITDDTEFDALVEIFDESDTVTHRFASIRDTKDSSTEKYYALIDGELVKIWDRE